MKHFKTHRYTAIPKSRKGEISKGGKTGSNKKKNKKRQEVPEVPDDAPTVLKEIVAKERAGESINFKEEAKDDKNASCCTIL